MPQKREGMEALQVKKGGGRSKKTVGDLLLLLHSGA
jgi:hypothetical protein